MKKRLVSLLILTLFIAISVLTGCSSENASQLQETTLTETTNQEQESQETEAAETSETVQAAEEEILFDFYSIPSDWPKTVPLHNEMKVTKYERTDNSMFASGFCTYDVFGLNNYYTNARKEVGGGYPWDYDPSQESVTEGSEQVFYFVSEEGQSLNIKFTEVEERMLTFELDYKE